MFIKSTGGSRLASSAAGSKGEVLWLEVSSKRRVLRTGHRCCLECEALEARLRVGRVFGVMRPMSKEEVMRPMSKEELMRPMSKEDWWVGGEGGRSQNTLREVVLEAQ